MLPISINIGDSHALLGLSTEIVSGIFGALVGAVVGGLITWAIQVWSWGVERRAREADRLLSQQAHANSIFVKLIKINANLNGLKLTLEDSFKKAKDSGLEGELWQVIEPAANPPAHVIFNESEMALLLSLKDDKSLRVIMELENTHNSIVDMMRLYGVERTALGERLKADDVTGALISGTYKTSEYLKFRPKMIALNSLISHVIAENYKASESSFAALQHLSKITNERLNTSFNVTRSDAAR